MTSLQEK